MYGTAAAVKTRTGVRPQDLGLEDDAALTTLLEELLTEASDLMNRRVRRNFTDELAAGDIDEIPAGINGIANDIVANAVAYMVQTRQTPIVTVGDFQVRLPFARVFTDDIVQRLKLYSAAGVASIDITPGDIVTDYPNVLDAILWDEEP